MEEDPELKHTGRRLLAERIADNLMSWPTTSGRKKFSALHLVDESGKVVRTLDWHHLANNAEAVAMHMECDGEISISV